MCKAHVPTTSYRAARLAVNAPRAPRCTPRARHIDPHSELMTVVAETLDGLLRTTRTVKLPCAVNQPRKITAQMHDGCVIVTIPADALAAAPEAPDAGAAPLAHQAPGAPVEPKEIKVHVYPPRAGQLEVDHDDEQKALKLTVHGVRAEGINVDLEGRILSVAGKAADGSSDVHRAYKLHARVLSPGAIKAVYDPAQHALVVSVPDVALEQKRKDQQRQKIAVS